MNKSLDWNTVASVNFDDKRRKAHGMMTYKEVMAKALENTKKSEQALQKRQEAEPILKKALIHHMVNRLPIVLLNPIQNPTESINGLSKSEEDDGFYNTSPSMSSEASLSARFDEVMEVIPQGTELIYKSWDKQLGQWLFKGSNGQEYAIYDKNVILFKGNAIENPGLYGLLFNTNLINYLDND